MHYNKDDLLVVPIGLMEHLYSARVVSSLSLALHATTHITFSTCATAARHRTCRYRQPSPTIISF